MRGRVELRAKLISAERIFRRLEAVLLVGVDVALLDESLCVRTGPCRREGGVGKAGPDRYVWRDRVGEVDVLCALQRLLIDRPEAFARGRLAVERHHDRARDDKGGEPRDEPNASLA